MSGAVVGERWRIGTVELEVCQPRLPCNKLALRMGEPTMVKRFAQASRPGAYLRIAVEGSLAAGDPIEVLTRPEHGITVRDVSDAILLDETLLERAASAPALPPTSRRGCSSAPPDAGERQRLWVGRVECRTSHGGTVAGVK